MCFAVVNRKWQVMLLAAEKLTVVSLSDGDYSRPMDSPAFIAFCSKCQRKRGVTCNIKDVAARKAVKVYAIDCEHSWTLSPQETGVLREKLTDWSWLTDLTA